MNDALAEMRRVRHIFPPEEEARWQKHAREWKRAHGHVPFKRNKHRYGR